MKWTNTFIIFTLLGYGNITTNDFYDITITTIINYDFWEVAPIETADYMTAYCPELLDWLALPVFGVLFGQITCDEAVMFIKEKTLLEDYARK